MITEEKPRTELAPPGDGDLTHYVCDTCYPDNYGPCVARCGFSFSATQSEDDDGTVPEDACPMCVIVKDDPCPKCGK